MDTNQFFLHKSEISFARSSLSKWCQGYGIDVGHGGDKIVPHAIAIDLPMPYGHCGSDPVQLGGDAANLYWFRNEVLDFVFSSHLLEDFENTTALLNEFSRVLKINGYLILYLPDEQLYREYCAREKLQRNILHKHDDFNAEYVKKCARKVNWFLELVHESSIINHYSFELVFKKVC